MIDDHQETKAYLVGAGIGSLAAAVFLIRDGGLKGENVHILEELPTAGGSLDGTRFPNEGYVTRGGRMLTEEAYVCLWNLLETIPSLEDPATSVKDDVWQFNAKWKSNAKARLIDKDHAIVDASDLQLNAHDRAEFARLLVMPEHMIGARRIEDFFSDHFFQTNFWYMWRTTFAFQNWHSAIELKRYCLRFIQELPRFHTLGGVRRTKYSQYDSVVRPIERWLVERGAKIEHGVRVEDADFETNGQNGHGGRRLERLHVTRDGEHDTIELGANDYAFLTLGSMTADATYGGDDSAPELIRDKRDGDWRLWETIAPKAPDFGRPNVFNGNVDEAKWESFTLTMLSPLLLHRIEEFSGNLPGTGGLMTFKDSGWLMSIVVPHQPHFPEQPEDVFTLWGYALLIDNEGDYVKKKFSEATGQEILTELVHQLGFEDALEEIRRTTSVITVMMPYITSQFERRQPEDRPLVVPEGSRNFAFLGQYVEVPEDVVFTVEYSVRGAMHGVYELLGIDKEIPGIYHGLLDPKVTMPVLRTSFG